MCYQYVRIYLVITRKLCSFARNLKVNLISNIFMKASILRKKILSLVVLFVCSLAMSAASPRNYLYDTKEENGKIVSKVIFLQEEGLLNKQVKYEFAYID